MGTRTIDDRDFDLGGTKDNTDFSGKQGNRYPIWEGLTYEFTVKLRQKCLLTLFLYFSNFYYSFGFNDDNEMDGSFSHIFFYIFYQEVDLYYLLW